MRLCVFVFVERVDNRSPVGCIVAVWLKLAFFLRYFGTNNDTRDKSSLQKVNKTETMHMGRVYMRGLLYHQSASRNCGFVELWQFDNFDVSKVRVCEMHLFLCMGVVVHIGLRTCLYTTNKRTRDHRLPPSNIMEHAVFSTTSQQVVIVGLSNCDNSTILMY